MEISKRSIILILFLSIIISPLFVIGIRADINIGQGLFDSDAILDNAGFKYGTQDWTKQAGSWSVSSDARPDGDPTDTQSLYISSGHGGYVQFYQALDTEDLDVIKGKYIEFSIWFKSWDDATQVLIKYQDWYHSWYTFNSDWIYASDEPGDMAWTHVSLMQFIPNEVLQVQVKVKVDDFITQEQQGQVEDYVQSYVDEAKIVIIDKSEIQTGYGKVALLTHLYEVDEGQQGYNYAELVTGISAHGDSFGANSYLHILGGYYTIGKLQIQVELVPTSQIGTINVINSGQANDKGVHVNPEEQQNDREEGAKIAASLLHLVKGIATSTLGPYVGLGIGEATYGFTSLLYDYVGESINGFDTYANGPSNYYTRVSWTYRDKSTYVRDAVATNYINWHYLRGYGNYRLKIVAKVTWDKWVHVWLIVPFWIHYNNVATTTIIDYIDV